MRLAALALVLAFPAAAASLQEGTAALQLRVEAMGGQPTTLLGARPALGVGLAWRLTDQIAAIGDVHTMAAPGGGITAFAAGLQATLDITPIVPYLELSVVALTNRDALGYSLATRTGAGADWWFARGLAVGVVVRTYTPFDPRDDDTGIAGFEAALRFTFTPGARR